MTVSVKPIIMVAVSAVCLLCVWWFLGPLVRFLFPGRVIHRHRQDLDEPDHPLADRLRELGFVYLGIRTESVGWLWRRNAAVYVLNRTVAADLVLPPALKGTYLMTFWPDGGCALTRVGPDRPVGGHRYRSTGSTRSDGIDGLLAAHRKNEAAVAMGDEPRPIESMEARLELAAMWYRDHGRSEFALPAFLGGLLALGFLGFGIYAVWLLVF